MTVTVPTRNRAHILPHTLRSILGQEDVSVSVVVVDEASSDNTAEVVQSIPGVQFIRHEQPKGSSLARNAGASIASTPWVGFCDDDDLWAPTKLRRQLNAAAASGADWSTTGAIHVSEDLLPVGGQRLSDSRMIDRYIYRQNIVPGGSSGTIVRRDLFERVGGFSEEAQYVEDWDLWIRLSQQGKVACVDELLVAYRKWAGAMSHATFDRQYAAHVRLTRKFGSPGVERDPEPRTSSAYEVRHRLLGETRRSIAKDLPRLLQRSPRETAVIMLMMGIPSPILKEFRLRRLGMDDVRAAEMWLAPYRDAWLEGAELPT